jgi:hypothetical protein
LKPRRIRAGLFDYFGGRGGLGLSPSRAGVPEGVGESPSPFDQAQVWFFMRVDFRTEPAAEFREVIHQRATTPGSLPSQSNGSVEIPLL